MKKSNIEQELTKLTQKVILDENIIGAIVFGSYLLDEFYKDVDIALIVKESLEDKEMLEIRIDYSKEYSKIFDIQIYQQLPTAVQKSVLKGRIIYETAELYDIAYKTIKDYFYLKKYVDDYVEGIRHYARPEFDYIRLTFTDNPELAQLCNSRGYRLHHTLFKMEAALHANDPLD